MKTYKIFSVLLAYPESELIEHLDQLLASLADEALLKKRQLKAIKKLVLHLQQTDLLDLQEQYVALFDRTRTLSLHLFEHVHGESRDRGQAMVDLADRYAQEGLVVNKGELPDYLPVFLEFLSMLPQAEVSSLLGEPVNILMMLAKRLHAKDSLYHVIFDALVTLSVNKPDMSMIKKALASDSKKRSDRDDLDKEWQEEPVRFMGGESASACQTGSCPQASIPEKQEREIQ